MGPGSAVYSRQSCLLVGLRNQSNGENYKHCRTCRPLASNAKSASLSTGRSATWRYDKKTVAAVHVCQLTPWWRRRHVLRWWLLDWGWGWGWYRRNSQCCWRHVVSRSTGHNRRSLGDRSFDFGLLIFCSGCSRLGACVQNNDRGR